MQATEGCHHWGKREKQCEEARERFEMQLYTEMVGKQQGLMKSPVTRGTSNTKGEGNCQDIFTAECDFTTLILVCLQRAELNFPNLNKYL